MKSYTPTEAKEKVGTWFQTFNQAKNRATECGITDRPYRFRMDIQTEHGPAHCTYYAVIGVRN